MSTTDQIIAMRRASPHKSPAAIADELQVSRQRVSQVLRRAKLPSDFRGVVPARRSPGPTKPFLEKAEAGQIVELLGLSTNDAAEWLGVHPVTMSKYINGGETKAGDPLVPPEAMQLLLLATLGLGHEGIRAAINEGRRRLKAAVDSAKNRD